MCCMFLLYCVMMVCCYIYIIFFLSSYLRMPPFDTPYTLQVDAPFVFRAFWNIVYPFIDKDTKEKIVFVKGDEEKEKVMGKYMSKDQCMPFFHPKGEMENDLNMKEYLYDVPFDFTFEDYC
mmetsp:Transcript_41570/g.60848  ORF Transcript_41570/g.60848 Transcript_41570/m.60848 type:complete len:121 (-) Transcript_41570:1625-1987(-)